MTQPRSTPVHPGELLYEGFMKPRNLSATALALKLGVLPARVRDIVKGKRPITVDFAVRLARYLDCDPMIWLEVRAQHDLQVARRKIQALAEQGHTGRST